MIHLILGPMWAGKTTALIDRVASLRADGKSVLVLKPRLDDRYDLRQIVSHDGASMLATIVRDEDHLTEVLNLAAGMVDAIAIDEIQFFPASIAVMLRELTSIEIVGAGLDRDCFGQWFTSSLALRNEASVATYMTARCYACGEDATMTRRFDASGAVVTAGEVVKVGGDDHYKPTCLGCSYV